MFANPGVPFSLPASVSIDLRFCDVHLLTYLQYGAATISIRDSQHPSPLHRTLQTRASSNRCMLSAQL